MCLHTNSAIGNMIKRPHYLQQLIDSRHNGFTKIITGVRRCGKSYLLQMIYVDYLLSIGVPKESILVYEMDLATNYLLRDPLALVERVLKDAEGKEDAYVIIDEIQNVTPIKNPAFTGGKHVIAAKGDKDAITFVNAALELSRRPNIDLYITGSNSRMLSRDVQTDFRDKATLINVRPLSFEECFDYLGGDPQTAFESFLKYGGMPLVIGKSDSSKESYLKELFSVTYFKDILDRYHFKRSEALSELASLLSSSVGSLLSVSKICNLYKAKGKGEIDDGTVNNYLAAFEDSFLLQKAKRYDVKGKRVIGSTKKYYFIDPGLRNASNDFVFEDKGLVFENIIYNELLYSGYEVAVGTYDSFSKNAEGITVRKSLEIDFIAKKGPRVLYVQCCQDLSSHDTYEREIKPYIALNDNIAKVLVVNKAMGQELDRNGITIIGATDFILRYIKQTV